MKRPSSGRWPAFMRCMRSLALGACAIAPAACRAPEPAPRAAESFERAEIERTLDKLYRSFCFDAGAEPDWETMRSLAVEGASWVAPIAPGAPPRAVATEQFLRDFRAWTKNSPTVRDGFHERILATHIDGFGTIAHAFVAFEGFVPGEALARTRGLDSIQLVHASEGWRVASFTTQYEAQGATLPGRFLRATQP